jgi:hypothetical protein
VSGQGERVAVYNLDRLEHAVPDGEPVIAHPDGRTVRIIEQSTVHPSVHTPEISR